MGWLSPDIYGRNPSSEEGEVFWTNIYSWHTILALVSELCSDLLDEQTLAKMAIPQDNGAGPLDQATCTEMAIRLEQWMKHHTEGHRLESDQLITKEGLLISAAELADNPGLEATSVYQVSDEELKNWVRFLQHCGGFAVC